MSTLLIPSIDITMFKDNRDTIVVFSCVLHCIYVRKTVHNVMINFCVTVFVKLVLNQSSVCFNVVAMHN